LWGALMVVLAALAYSVLARSRMSNLEVIMASVGAMHIVALLFVAFVFASRFYRERLGHILRANAPERRALSEVG